MAEGGGLTDGQIVGIGIAVAAGLLLLLVLGSLLAACISEVRFRRRHWKRVRWEREEERRRQCQAVYPGALSIHEAPVDVMPVEAMPEEPEPAVIHDDSYRYYCKARDAASESVARDDGLPSYDPLPAYTPDSGGSHTGDVCRTEYRRPGDDNC
ncbi:hypothetical protein ASPVEDRAFT_391513 [Aspergillus versicolor CBS 583.65]|uniref:Uncharacterized protein n=1 Tax=Aspergillus versicolor CBS 583.65 TaxID=1036611 RepID=A0A1L9Q362_ASPVE|nr:uncharacterized protein ASPVEDRAFT_391513 [Aspergillus versicolor CBS 583.65]OJJ08187.1 hypothetical protein ASPVEDRAFT_391513 [Aspergillus versicolor CBS 583.65]